MTSFPDAPAPLESTKAADIVRGILDRLEFVTAPDGVVYTVPTAAARPRLASEATDLDHAIAVMAWEELGAVLQPSQRAAAAHLLRSLSAEAPVRPVALRAHHDSGVAHLDLARADARLARIDSTGWTVAPASPASPLFRRTAASAELPLPEHGGSRDELRELLGLAATDPRWRLVWGWLVASLLDDIPRPLLFMTGPQGSGKSSSARFIRSVVEPGELGPAPSDDVRDLATAAAGHFIPAHDNLSHVSRELSDWLCRVVTGQTVTRRALFTDGALFSQSIRRTGVLTAIALPGGLRNDALERLVHVELERVSPDARRTESSLWREFHAAHPRILGALLDDVSGVLAHLAAAEEVGLVLPRMADYALALAALDLHLDIDPRSGDSHLGAYTESVEASLSERASDDPFVSAVVSLVDSTRGTTWEGTATELKAALEPARPDEREAYWPGSPAQHTNAVIRESEALSALGVTVTRERVGRDRTRVIRLAR